MFPSFRDKYQHELLTAITQKGLRPPLDVVRACTRLVGECWSAKPGDRPSWAVIIDTLSGVIQQKTT